MPKARALTSTKHMQFLSTSRTTFISEDLQGHCPLNQPHLPRLESQRSRLGIRRARCCCRTSCTSVLSPRHAAVCMRSLSQ
eukprot:9496083-Pyramimonas_sp.AAC.1